MGYGMKGGDGPTQGKKARRFLCVSPDGTAQKTKRSFIDATNVAAVWYQNGGVWHLNTIVDRDAPPYWVQPPYSMHEATEIK